MNRLIFSFICLFLCSGTPFTVQASLAGQCERGFNEVKPMDRMSLATLKLIDTAMKAGGPFADREESKFTVSTRKIDQYVDHLGKRFGQSWKERDRAEDGRVNVTQTFYAEKMRYRNQLGSERRVKIRFREYLTTDPSDLQLSHVQNTIGTSDKEWLEVKVQHPEQNKKVIKVRALIFKSDRKYFADDSYLGYRDLLISRTKALNFGGPKPLISEDKFSSLISFLDEVSRSPRKRTGLYAQTRYRRRSFSVKLPVTNSENSIEVQLTLDDRIQLTRLSDNKKFDDYLPGQTVVEVKIPSLFSGLTSEDLRAVRGLDEIKKMILWLKTEHDTRLPMNKGKLSKVRPPESKERDKETEDLAGSYFEDLFE